MAHIGILCPHNAGHLLPEGTLGRELARRGHRVTLLGLAQSAPIAQQLDLHLHVLAEENIRGPSFPIRWTAFNCFGASWMIGLLAGYSRQAEILLQCVPPALKELAVDGLLIDQTFAGGGTVAEHLGLPYVTVSAALPWDQEVRVPPLFTPWAYTEGPRARWRNRLAYAGWRWYLGPILKIVNRYRRAWKLRPLQRLAEEYSPLAQICQLCRELDFPRRELPPAFHYVGPLAASRPDGNTEFPWDRLNGRPLIYASLGTVSDPANRPIFRKILAACAGIDAQLVLALGKWTDCRGASLREELGDLPQNALVVDFAPQLALLDKAALAISHAGQNTVMEALSRAVPIVAIPRSADQPGVAARVQYAGVGLMACSRSITTDALRQMIERVLTEEPFRRRAQQLQHAIAAAGGAPRAADIVEAAFTTRRPVLR
jgi:MGT family glycosyltransferase